MQHTDGEMAAARDRGGGGDGVVAGSHRWQQLQVDVERQVAAGEVVQQLEHRLPRGGHPLPISLPACIVEARHGLQLGRLVGVCRISGEDGKIIAAGDILQFDASPKDAE